jgi:hypothetical protein
MSLEPKQERDGGSSPKDVPDGLVLTATDVEQLQWTSDLWEAQESLLQYAELFSEVISTLTAKTPTKETDDALMEMKNSEMIDAEESLIAHAESSRFVLFCHGTIFGCNHLSVCQMLSPG